MAAEKQCARARLRPWPASQKLMVVGWFCVWYNTAVPGVSLAKERIRKSVNIRPESNKKRARRPRTASRATPVRNGLLLLALAAVLALIVAVTPKEPVQSQAVVIVDGAETDVATLAQAATLAITEVMASNHAAYPDETGNYPDWVEITNTGTEPQQMEGIGLSDREDRVLFLFPEMTLEPGGHVVVFCDDTSKAVSGEALHARFKISALGETIYLFNTAAQVIDSVTVPALQSDVSYALVGGSWQVTEQFTPGYDNTDAGWEQLRTTGSSQAQGLVINELMASNVTAIADEDGEYSDWIELYNGTSHVIDLSNYALTDDPADRVKWRFPSGAQIQPGEYYIVFASGKDRREVVEGRKLHTNFRLAADGETVMLCDILGQIVDSVTYDNLPDNVSWARVEGLSNTWQEASPSTPGMPNNRSSQLEMDRMLRAQNTTGLFISEVMTSSTGVETPYGRSSYDWVEIYNASSVPLSLKGFWLSDNVNRPRKYQFGDVTIPAGGYLVVFPSGLTESPTGSGAIHVPFRLSALGETVVLSDPSGKIVDELVVPQLETNVSYGRNFDQGGLFYYTETTAGAKNGQGFSGYAVQPTMDKAGGTYAQQVTVTLSAPEGVRIRYTTDGSEPTEENGTDYTGPITLTSNAALRARGFQEGLQPSAITTATFLVNVYHSLPIICLVCDPDDLYNETDGILAVGTEEDFSSVPFDDAVYWLKTPHPGNFEYFTAEGVSQLNQGVELQLNGQYSLDQAQKSWRITAKAKYGGETLDYPFFDDRPYTSYHALILRNGGQDGKYTRIIDALQGVIVDWTGSDIFHMAYKPVVVYLNGQYWGQYNLRERINKYSIADYEGWSDPDAIDLIKGDDEVIGQTSRYDNYGELKAFVNSHNLAEDPEALQTVLDWVDVDNYFDFMIFQIYFGNTDAGNIKFYRQRVEGAKWRWCLFDLDWGYFNSTTNGCKVWLDPNGAGDKDFENWLILSLLEVPELKDQFLTRFGQLFQEVFSDTERIWAQAQAMAAVIQPELMFHYNRWAGETSKLLTEEPDTPEGNYSYWEQRMERLHNVLKKRPNLCWEHIRDWFGMTDAEMEAYFGPQPEMPADDI